MRWRFGQHDFQSRPDASFEQMPAGGRAIRFAQHGMGMELRLAATQRYVADERKHLDLFIDGNLLVILLLSIEKTEHGVFKCADSGEMACGEIMKKDYKKIPIDEQVE